MNEGKEELWFQEHLCSYERGKEELWFQEHLGSYERG